LMITGTLNRRDGDSRGERDVLSATRNMGSKGT